MHIITILIIWFLLSIFFKKIKYIILFIILIIISVWKELFDLYYRHTVFWVNDIYADFIGIIIFTIIYLFFIYKK